MGPKTCFQCRNAVLLSSRQLFCEVVKQKKLFEKRLCRSSECFFVWIYSRCTTNVEIEITDRPDAGMVKGRHNLLFCGVSAYLRISH
jgi:hypothetical protein